MTMVKEPSAGMGPEPGTRPHGRNEETRRKGVRLAATGRCHANRRSTLAGESAITGCWDGTPALLSPWFCGREMPGGPGLGLVLLDRIRSCLLRRGDRAERSNE